jgi:Transcriptional regulator
MLNFNHLLIFHKVAEKRNYTRAAEELYISQPAVSKQIQELEKALGQPLFSRIGRKIYLTEAGQLLFQYTRQIFTLAEEAEAVLKDLGELHSGRLAIGASTTIGTYLLPAILSQFRQQYPGIELFLDIENTEAIQKRIIAHDIEIGIVEGNVTYDELTRTIWRKDELVLIAAPHSAYAQQAQADQTLTLNELFAAQPPLILREPGSGTRDVFEHALAARDIIRPQPLMELGSTEAIKQVVIAGLGLSFVSEHTIRLELAAGLLQRIPLSDFQLTRPLYIIYPQQQRLSRAAQVFLYYLEQAASAKN